MVGRFGALRASGSGCAGSVDTLVIEPAKDIKVYVYIKGRQWNVVKLTEFDGGSFNPMFGALAQTIVAIFESEKVQIKRIKRVYDSTNAREQRFVLADLQVLASPPVPYKVREVDGKSVLAGDVRIYIPAKNLDPDSTVALYDVQLRR